MTRRLLGVTPCLVGVLVSVPAVAQEGGVDFSAGASLGGDPAMTADASADAPAPAAPSEPEEKGYMEKYRPEANLFEAGVFGGMMFPSDEHNLADPARDLQPYDQIAPELGLRLAYFPWPALGVEAEAAAMPTATDDGQKAGIWAARGHAVLQLPLYSIVPFLLVGGGALGVGSDSLGTDIDPAFHFGGGVKFPLDDFISLRLDARDTMTQKGNAEDGAQTHHPELLLGITFTMDRDRPPPPPPPDRDADGIEDASDACPDLAGVAPDGCPPPPPDTDGDGVLDADDRCPDQAGPAPEGCPPPPDPDGDGIAGEADQCPDVAGEAPSGCPNPDPDGDGIAAPADQCPTEAETKNGYQDADGCPDEIPAEVQKFTGTIQGIEFNFGQATIRPVSKTTLDAAAATLKQYTDVRVKITGHTDNVGPRERNVELSGKRAEAVKQYLVDAGVDAARIETEGAGPDKPIADNKTAEGAQKNRRIEFQIITQ